MRTADSIKEDNCELVNRYDTLLSRFEHGIFSQTKNISVNRLSSHLETYLNYFYSEESYLQLKPKFDVVFATLSDGGKLERAVAEGKLTNKTESEVISDLAKGLEKEYLTAILDILNEKAILLGVILTKKLSDLDKNVDMLTFLRLQQLSTLLKLSPTYNLGVSDTLSEQELEITLRSSRSLHVSALSVTDLLNSLVSANFYLDLLIEKSDRIHSQMGITFSKDAIWLISSITKTQIEPFFTTNVPLQSYEITDSEGMKTVIRSYFSKDRVESSLLGLWLSPDSESLTTFEIKQLEVKVVDLY